MGKTVLILGNGFDLAHGLPTKYSDFLNFCHPFFINPFAKIVIDTWLNTNIKDRNIKNKCSEYFLTQYDYFFGLLNGNAWYDFLYHQYEQKLIKGENWIDFESEISSIIQLLDKKTENLLHEFKIPQYPSKDILYKNNKLKWFLAKYVELKNLNLKIQKNILLN